MTEAEAIAHDVAALVHDGGRIVAQGRSSTVIEMLGSDGENEVDDGDLS